MTLNDTLNNNRDNQEFMKRKLLLIISNSNNKIGTFENDFDYISSFLRRSSNPELLRRYETFYDNYKSRIIQDKDELDAQLQYLITCIESSHKPINLTSQYN